MSVSDKLRKQADIARGVAETLDDSLDREAWEDRADALDLLADAYDEFESIEATADRPFIPPACQSMMERIERFADGAQ